jgi:hypothetical protein
VGGMCVGCVWGGGGGYRCVCGVRGVCVGGGGCRAALGAGLVLMRMAIVRTLQWQWLSGSDTLAVLFRRSSGRGPRAGASIA